MTGRIIVEAEVEARHVVTLGAGFASQHGCGEEHSQQHARNTTPRHLSTPPHDNARALRHASRLRAWQNFVANCGGRSERTKAALYNGECCPGDTNLNAHRMALANIPTRAYQAAQQPDPKRHNRPAQRGRAKYALLLLVLLLAFALTVLMFYPGYITGDAGYVYAEAKAWRFGDWQSPAMGVIWRIVDPLAPGSLSMFLLTVTLYWLGFGALAFIALRSSISLALLTLLLAFTPPAFILLALIWRDILFGVIWLAAAVLAFAAAEWHRWNSCLIARCSRFV